MYSWCCYAAAITKLFNHILTSIVGENPKAEHSAKSSSAPFVLLYEFELDEWTWLSGVIISRYNREIATASELG